MNNADMPAMPNLKKWVSENAYESISDGGLTKREYFAGLAMQGLLSGACFESKYHFTDLQTEAVGIADALLAKLEKSNGQS